MHHYELADASLQSKTAAAFRKRGGPERYKYMTQVREAFKLCMIPCCSYIA